MSRLHLVTCAIPNPSTLPAFCQFLRAHFQGTRIENIHQIPNDRIVEIQFTGKKGGRTLVCELTGKHANILVLDAERHVLRDVLHRHDRIGHPYNPLTKRATSPPEHRPSRFSDVTSDAFPISAAIEAHYQEKESALAIDTVKAARQRAIKKLIKKGQRRIEVLQEDLMKVAKYRDYARYGELIKANLGSVKKGVTGITVVDYFDERLPEVTIPLDPAKSAQGNMDDYFRKYRKYLTAERELKPRIEHAEQELNSLRQELRAIEQGIWAPPAAPLSDPGTDTGVRLPLHKKGLRSRDQWRGPYRRFTSTDGLPIFVGRNARENDELTFGLAKGDDLWLHACHTPGSHVVVRLEKGADPPTETIRDAATLALLYSDLKKSGKGDVIYTRRKWLKKAKGRAPGAVIVTQEKSLHVHLDQKRLDSLKARSAQE